jgi:hypothetical protein
VVAVELASGAMVVEGAGGVGAPASDDALAVAVELVVSPDVAGADWVSAADVVVGSAEGAGAGSGVGDSVDGPASDCGVTCSGAEAGAALGGKSAWNGSAAGTPACAGASAGPPCVAGAGVSALCLIAWGAGMG